MYKDKNYGLPKDLLETVRSVVLENKIESEFKKYLDENFHVEQLTEEEIQWIFENEFYNQLNEEEKSLFGKALQYLPGYEASRKNFAAKQKQLKGMSTLDAIGTTLGDFASRAPSALAAIPAGRVAGTAAKALVSARTATPARTAASAKPTGTNVAPRPGTSVKKPETGVKKNTGGQGGPIPLKSTNAPGSKNKNFDFGKFRANAQTLRTPEQIAKTRKAMVAAGAAGAGGAIVAALNSTKSDGPGSASAKPKKVTAKDRKDLFKGMPAGDPSSLPTAVKPTSTAPAPGPGMPGFRDPTKSKPTDIGDAMLKAKKDEQRSKNANRIVGPGEGTDAATADRGPIKLPTSNATTQAAAPTQAARRRPTSAARTRRPRPTRNTSDNLGSDRPMWQQRALKVGRGMEDLA